MKIIEKLKQSIILELSFFDGYLFFIKISWDNLIFIKMVRKIFLTITFSALILFSLNSMFQKSYQITLVNKVGKLK